VQAACSAVHHFTQKCYAAAQVLAMFDKRSASYDSNETGFHPRLARCAHNSLSVCLILCHKLVPHLVS